MLLQNMTFLNNDAVVKVTNIRAPSKPEIVGPPLSPPPFKRSESATPTISAPLLPGGTGSPLTSTQIIVSIGSPGSMGSSTVYTGEPTINGLEGARRAANDAAERARMSIEGGGRPDVQPQASDAYAEAGAVVNLSG